MKDSTKHKLSIFIIFLGVIFFWGLLLMMLGCGSAKEVQTCPELPELDFRIDTMDCSEKDAIIYDLYSELRQQDDIIIEIGTVKDKINKDLLKCLKMPRKIKNSYNGSHVIERLTAENVSLANTIAKKNKEIENIKNKGTMPITNIPVDSGATANIEIDQDNSMDSCSFTFLIYTLIVLCITFLSLYLFDKKRRIIGLLKKII